MNADEVLRAQLLTLLQGRGAHMTFDEAVADFPMEHINTRPPGVPYTMWHLLEHLRIAQRDILDFCRDPAYIEPKWPNDYWPSSVEPPSPDAWDESIAAFRADRDALKSLAADTPDLFAEIPHGSGQTYLRELLLVADHGAYHVGQLVLVRRLLGAWPGA